MQHPVQWHTEAASQECLRQQHHVIQQQLGRLERVCDSQFPPCSFTLTWGPPLFVAFDYVSNYTRRRKHTIQQADHFVNTMRPSCIPAHDVAHDVVLHLWCATNHTLLALGPEPDHKIV